jgi:hypothetical protein
LPDFGFRFELSADARTNLYFYYSDSTIGIPTHNLGAFPATPVRTEVNLTNRHCGILIATTFTANGCQSLNVAGKFGEVGDGKMFRGSYTITDEESGDKCTYDMVLDREKLY